MDKFYSKFNDVLSIFKKAFNDGTKEMILSHGEKIVAVQHNPFIKDVLKESLDVAKIEWNNQKMGSYLDVFKKYTKVVDEKAKDVLKKLEDA